MPPGNDGLSTFRQLSTPLLSVIYIPIIIDIDNNNNNGVDSGDNSGRQLHISFMGGADEP